MHNIGNDIIDLKLAKTQSNWQRKGFLEKQFTEKEQKHIINSLNPFLQVWLFWSMKEAAYKCYVQQYKKRFFAPKKFLCKIISNQEGTVQIDNEIYNVTFIISDNYIHSVAAKKQQLNIVSELFYFDKSNSKNKILDYKLLSLFSAETKLQKNSLGIPYFYKNNVKLPISISKSHHGNYGGFVILYN
ncbi:4'-phosphopantetheinyl transferase superfamily protein [Polaribacter sp.]|nr:4'-phosphopantetheinyl transferase superfamily protein [Polaribacter sp.]